MARFTGRLLGLIDRLFQFPAGSSSAPTEYSVESPIQPVHDVGRPAELAAGFGFTNAPGIWLIGPGHVHAGGDDQYSLTDPRTVIATQGVPGLPPTPNEFDVWWLGTFAWSETNGIIAAAIQLAVFPPSPGQVLQSQMLLFNGNGRCSIPLKTGGASADAATTSVQQPEPPVLLPLGTFLNCRTSAVAATPGTITTVARCWVGPRGARPPGLA